MRRLAAVFIAVGLGAGAGAGCDDASKPKADPTGPAPTEAAHVHADEKAPPAPDPLEAAAPADLVAHGKELVGKYECSRCHEIEGIEAATLEFNCALCHQQIRAGTFTADRKNLPHYQKRVKSLIDVPKLEGTGRLRRSWLASFLPDAHDLRPNLVATMPRFEMSAEDAKAMAAFLVPEAEQERPELGDATKGRAVLEGKGCMSCHRFSGAPPVAATPFKAELTPDVYARAQQLAPDLRFSRDRLRHADLVAWIQDPKATKASTLMPNLSVTAEEARDAAAFILQAELEPIEYPPVPAAAAKPTEKVTWQHVYDRVFGKTCRHCHSDPDEVIGDGGPGYIGGFGFRQRKLDLSSHQGALSGSLDDNGKRRSLFKKNDDGVPRLVAQLWARHAEVAGKPVEGITGMPLGLPPLPPEDIALIEAWIEQGRLKQ